MSTVGGWVATRASGQLSTRYGKIEDLLLALEVVLPGGRTAEVGINTGAGAGSAELGVRPAYLAIVDPNDPHAVFAGAIAIIEHLGNSTILYVDTPAGQLIIEGECNLDAKSGQAVGLRLNEDNARLFGKTGAAP